MNRAPIIIAALLVANLSAYASAQDVVAVAAEVEEAVAEVQEAEPVEPVVEPAVQPVVEPVEVEPAAPVEAVEDPRLVAARAHIENAEAAYAREDYEAALVEFEATAALLQGHSLRFRVLFNVGRCQERLLRYQDALISLRAFLSTGGEFTEQAPEVRAKLELLEGLLGTVRLSVDVQDYEVWVSDRLIGRTLDEVLLPSGRHPIEIRKDGYVANQQEALVIARRDVDLSFEMTRLADEFEGISPGYFVTSTVVTVLSLAGGATLGVMALGRRNDIQSRSPALAQPEETEEIRSLALGADILFGVAALGAASAIIFALFTDWGDDDSDVVRVRPAVNMNEGGFVIEGAF